MPDTGVDGVEQQAVDLGRHYLIRFEEDTLRSRPLWIRVIIEFASTYLLVTVAAGAGVINQFAGGQPITRAAAVIAPGGCTSWGTSSARSSRCA